ncbi:MULTISPECIES: asparagine synthase-related protein [unclassified Thiocapsa]
MGRDCAEHGLRRLDRLSRVQTQLEPPPGRPFARIATLESSLYMRNQLPRDTDRASMAHSLEIRVPLVDSTTVSERGTIHPPGTS